MMGKNSFSTTLSLVWLLLQQSTLSSAKCPYGYDESGQADARRRMLYSGETAMSKQRTRDLTERSGDGGIPDGGFAAVKEDIKALLTNSQDFWPADFGNYGGLMIRLAWHCAGSYRHSDGRGGCDGGRIRFDPELNWMDNANLDKALELLEPIKEKYGSKLSWGDLVMLAGTTAMESMGLPDPGFCGGRIDDPDGADSFILGPSDEQEKIAPCVSIGQDGLCNLVEGSAIGPTTVGLIYVNPAGPIDNPNNPVASGLDIRRTFGRMGFNDTETVALVGGGHAFGKCHGACLEPPCGTGNLTGIGANTFTSGFEGKWTTTPTVWSNEYYKNLFNFDWVQTQSPAGQVQWTPSTTNGSVPDIFMLTADLALAQDEIYRPISQKYASDQALLEQDFGAAWYRLASSDMGPETRCIGEFVRPPQHWQHTLPKATADVVVDYVAVRSKIQALLDADDSNYNAFVHLAYQCYSTFRMTDYRGGCNGARIRFSPESEWDVNAGTADALATLQPVKDAFPDASFSDIIVLAGQTAIEGAGGNPQPFCGGRTDAVDGTGSDGLEPRIYDPPLVSVIDDMQVKGLTPDEAIALMARPTGPSFSNQFFKDLLPYATGSNSTSNGTSVSSAMTSFTDYELAVLKDKEFLAIISRYADFEAVFQEEFAKAWNKIMTVDRHDGPFDNACKGITTCTTTPCVISGEQSQTDVESSGTADVPTHMAMIVTSASVASLVALGTWFSM